MIHGGCKIKWIRRSSVIGSLVTSMFFLILFSQTVSAQEPVFFNIQLRQSIDQVNWGDVDGVVETGFTMILDPTVPWYYMDIKYADTNVPLAEGFYGFNLTAYPSGFFQYWEERGVNESSPPGSWQAHMWQIINGNAPIFYIYVQANQEMHLIDGLMRDWAGDDTAILRVNGDYLLGYYTYNGTVVSEDGNSSTVIFSMKFVSTVEYRERVKVADISLKQSNDQISWSEMYGSLCAGFSIPVNSTEPMYYIDVKEASFDCNLSEGFYGFYLSAYPPGYLTYWAANGVTASASPGTWEAHMWRIINGSAPAFYLHVDENQDYSLVDGLLKDYYGYLKAVYRFNGDTPLGEYSYVGRVASEEGLDSDSIQMFFTLLNYSSAILWVDDNYDSSTPGWGVTHFNRIAAAINASVNGTIIRVQPGSYEEVITIDKPVVLCSVWGALSTIITDEDATYSELSATGGQTVQLASNHVLIENFTIERFESVVLFAAVGNHGEPNISHVEIRGCRIQSFFDCTYFSEVDNLSIIGTLFTAQYDDTPLVLTNITDFILFQNDLSSYNFIAASLTGCTKGYLAELEIVYKRYGGVVVDNCSNLSIDTTTFSDIDGGALYATFSHAVDVTNSEFTGNYYGVNLGRNTTLFLENNSYSGNDRNINHAVRIDAQHLYYSEIQHAIDDAEEKAEINIYPGNYSENLRVNKTLELHGLTDASETIIQGGNVGPTLLIGSDRDARDVVVDELTITGGQCCLRTGRHRSVSGLIVEDCIIRDPAEGVAVYIDPHNYTDVSSTRNGTYIFVKPVLVTHTTVEGGFLYQYWPYEVYPVDVRTQLRIQYSTIDSVFLNGSISVEIDHNTINSLGMMYSRDVSIHHNVFENPWEERYGVYLWSINGTPAVSDVEINRNTIAGYTSFTASSGVTGKGVVVAGARDVVIEGNEIRDCTDGVWLTERYQNRKGVWCIGDVTGVFIGNNDIENCNTGVKILYNVNETVVDGNSFEGNGKGVWVHGSDGHVLANNSFLNNYKGIQFDEGSSNNLVYNNYFDNIINAYDLFSTSNRWNVSLREGTNILGGPYIGGNYWSDYEGEDVDGDSIGDTLTPYNASGNIAFGGDYLPVILSDLTPPVVRVIHPNGGESLNGTVTIRWSAYDDFDVNLSIDIFYSNDSGSTWHLLSPNEENDGEYDWDTSGCPEGTAYLVKVRATDNVGHNSSDTSDGTFAIYREVPGPTVTITSPLKGYLYFFSEKKMRFLHDNCFIFGHIVIEANVESPLEVEKVEFYIDDLLSHTSYGGEENVYSWKWDEPVLFYHEIRVVAYDVHGKTGEDMIGVTIFNFNIIP